MSVVLVDKGYPTSFNTPRFPQKHTLRRIGMPNIMGKIWRPLDGVGLWPPYGRFDLVHTFNRIPLRSRRPWIVTYESFLPRTFGPNQALVGDLLRDQLLTPMCRKVIAISEYAVRRTEQALAGWDGLEKLRAKTEVIHPNIEVKEGGRKYGGGALSVVFVGNDFARKGGIVALRMARQASERRLPVDFHLISSMRYGPKVYADYKEKAAYENDLKNIQLKNVTLHRGLPNAEVMRIIEDSDFILLPTLHDTYGFSLLEGMSRGVPAIATDTAAIPEFVKHGVNGFLLPLPNDPLGTWEQLDRRPFTWEILDETYDHLANAAIECLGRVLDEPHLWGRISHGALTRIREHHDAHLVGNRIEQIYSDATES